MSDADELRRGATRLMQLIDSLAPVFAALEPTLATETCAFVSIPDGVVSAGCWPLASFREHEGLWC